MSMAGLISALRGTSSFRPSASTCRQLPQQRLCMSSGDATTIIRTLEPGSHISEMEVKKSRFIGYASHASNWDDAKAYIDTVKQEHPKARHWCFGFQCGVNPVTERSSDDGEPTGTAGAPILGAIQGEDLSDVVCVVVRYFGGIKLGAGGLIRAYGGAARLVLREAPILETLPTASFLVVLPSKHVGGVYGAVGKVGAVTTREEYLADGSVTLTISCDLAVLASLKASLSDATKGEVEFKDE
ncbi:IMPACT family member [Seminavis robusta]|uniref:IMPACT family member n=1 Tax=Seminavis robusta TaxID=568900 RepID=A0A9N8ENG0_9STRA|nr:IMPACT family member [Seminavis robusta]|eukprot:Sro1281_g258930.1 IMPACT family member (242) ;mRNA; f:16151-16876